MPPKSTVKEMSAFERRRLENMAANNAMLKDISVTAQKIIPKKEPRAPAPRSRTRAEPVKRERTIPTRMSSRLAGLGANEESLKRKIEEIAEQVAEREKAKRTRVNGDLSLGDIVVDGRKWDNSMDGLKSLVRGAQPGMRTFTEEDVTETTDENLKELRLRMSGMKLYEGWAPNDIKIVPQRVYAMGFHPTEDKPIIFAGDKEGAMGVFDASQEGPTVDDDDEDADIPDPVISAFKTHARTISSFAFSPSDANTVYTSSYDSSVRKLDLGKGVSVQVYAPSDESEDAPISTLEIPTSEPQLLYFSTLQGAVGRYDPRTEKDEVWWLSETKIGGFSLHPLHPHLLATASLDRTVKIWDLRKITGKGTDRLPSLVGEHASRLSVSHAAWSAGGHVATSSYDDTIKIHAFPDCGTWAAGHTIGEQAMAPAHIVRHNNQTGRWVTILKPQWQRRPRDGIQKFVIGNMNRFVDVFAADGSQLAQLDGEGISAVPAVAQFHPTVDWVAGGTASGKLCFWL